MVKKSGLNIWSSQFKDEDAAWQRDNADKVGNMFTAYGTGVGGLTAVLGPDPRRGNFKKERRK